MKKTATLLAITGLALSSNVDGNFQDDELFAQIAARAGVWALTHPQQITKGVEVGLRSAPAVIGGAKKAYDWVRRHDDDEFFAQDDELFAEDDDEFFAPVVARAGVWALTHPQQITKGVEVGIKAAPAVIGGAKKAIDWIKHHDDDELFAEGDDEFFVEGDQDDEFYAEEDDELFAQIAARAGVWALTHPQQITKGVEVGLRSAPAVIGGAKKAYDWVRRHDDEFFAQEDDELFVEKKSEMKPKKNGQKLRGGHHVEKQNLEQLGDLIKEGHKL